LEGRAQFDETKEREVSLRLASHQGNLYLGLGNLAQEVVEITAQGWRIITDPPVCFHRAQSTLALPRPEPGGSLQELRPSCTSVMRSGCSFRHGYWARFIPVARCHPGAQWRTWFGQVHHHPAAALTHRSGQSPTAQGV